jgi:hypothetical protein
MPVEIRELVIRAITEPLTDQRETSAKGSVAIEEKEAIVAACVREVLRIIRQEKER